MNQLSLGLTPRLPYGAENFLLHSGVREPMQLALDAASHQQFRLLYVNAPQRSGKTHFSICFADRVARLGFMPRFVEGVRGLDQLQASQGGRLLTREDILILDDADRILSGDPTAVSGPFVAAVEGLRVVGGMVLLLSSRGVNELAADEHVMSRIRAGEHCTLGAPSDAELTELVEYMARQRGLELPRTKKQFISRRIGRTVAAVDQYFERLAQLSRTLGKPPRSELIADAVGEE